MIREVPTPLGFSVRLEAADTEPAWDWVVEATSAESGLAHLTVRGQAAQASVVPIVRLSWRIPACEIRGIWAATGGFDKALSVDWGAPKTARSCSGAPVACLFDAADQNRLTFSVGEFIEDVDFHAGLHEETAEMECFVRLFRGPGPNRSEVTFSVRIDMRALPFWESLAAVSKEWEGLGGPPAASPPGALVPTFATWYAFHQNLRPEEIEEQCRLAREWGCGAVVVDDGWQTLDTGRGYAFCGDWIPERIPGMRAHVERIRAMGIKYVLWFSVPFAGFESQLSFEFADRSLHSNPVKRVHVLDPRFPEVRQRLINTWCRALREWNVDGFKLDFVDAFLPGADSPREAAGGRDIASIPAAVDRLLSDGLAALRAINPDVLIEFRQSYTGPAMRRYGTMFRVGDCPNDVVRNRVGICDLRLLCGETAVHADPLVWHPDDSVESAALHLLNTLFAVPQISVCWDRLPGPHQSMLRFWLKFWQDHANCLVLGNFSAHRPLENYPVITTWNTDEAITVVHSCTVCEMPVTPLAWFANASSRPEIILRFTEPRELGITTWNTTGVIEFQGEKRFSAGIHSLPVPRSGLLRLNPMTSRQTDFHGGHGDSILLRPGGHDCAFAGFGI